MSRVHAKKAADKKGVAKNEGDKDEEAGKPEEEGDKQVLKTMLKAPSLDDEPDFELQGHPDMPRHRLLPNMLRFPNLSETSSRVRKSICKTCQ